MDRRAGILIPLFSLRGPRGVGIGEMTDLVGFAEWGARCGFTVVQVLPLNEAPSESNSPYSAVSGFALDPVYLSLAALEDFVDSGGWDKLKVDGALLERLEASPRVVWSEVRHLKQAALEQAFAHFVERGDRRGLDGFAEAERAWLEDYGLYRALREEMREASWRDWPEPLRRREPGALEQARARLRDRIRFFTYVQWRLHEQWDQVRQALSRLGVRVLGDLPFVVADDSADVWAQQDAFEPDASVGVPPDAFSDTGQNWSLPVYDWARLAADDYRWFRARANHLHRIYDGYRVDHAVGFYRTYAIPNDGRPPRFSPPNEPEQQHQGEALFRLFASAGGGAYVIAEDLGPVPDFVRQSLARLSIPGFRVLRWERDGNHFRDPRSWPACSLGTTGTHDTESLAEWYESLEGEARWNLHRVAGGAPPREDGRFDDRVRDELVRLVMQSGSELALFPFPDLFGDRDRMNLPGTVGDQNWTYRIQRSLSVAAEDARLRELVRAGGRL